MSPQTLTGAQTGYTLDSSKKISFALSQTTLRSLSLKHPPLSNFLCACLYSYFYEFKLIKKIYLISHELNNIYKI